MTNESKRYLRHSLIDWFDQESLKTASIVIIGCGAVGNEVAKNLALLGVGRISLFDFDTIEIHNLTRSVLFRESDVGQSKAEVAAQRLSELDPNVSVCAFHGDFWDTLTLDLLKSTTCVICCVDNFEARIRLNTLCLIARVSLINTGIDSRYVQAEVYPFGAKESCACYECNLPISAYERIQERYSCGWLKKVAFSEKKVPTTIITSSLSGALAVSQCLNLLREEVDTESRRVFQDSFTGVSTVSQLGRNEECPACRSLKDNVVTVKGGAHVDDCKFALAGLDVDVRIVSSDPIVFSARCIKCLKSSSPKNAESQLVRNFTSADIWCESCKTDTVEFDIRDTFTISELIDNFRGKVLQVKFLRVEFPDKTLVIDLEKNHGRN